MELAELKALTTDIEGNFTKLRDTAVAEKPVKDTVTFLKQYDPEKHDIMDTAKRPDKIIETDSGPSSTKVARIPVSMQKHIVDFAAAVMCATPVQIVSKPETDIEKEMLSVIRRTWHDNKLDYDNMPIAQMLMSETEVAEIWYKDDTDGTYWNNTSMAGSKFRMRMLIAAPSKGDTLTPVFNRQGDMILFMREFKSKEAGKNVDYCEMYTDTEIFIGVKKEGDWVVTKGPNAFKKIPVVYYSQAAPEWADVQRMIDRYETSLSNHADSNDYFSSPIVFVEGEIEGFASKGEQGKVLKGTNGAKAELLTWDQSPESMKLEQTNLRTLIHVLTKTLDLSIDQMKAMGVFSGTALKLLFFPAHLKAALKVAIFGKGIQRRLNIIKAGLAVIKTTLEPASALQVSPLFTFFLPTNDKETIEMIDSAVSGGFLSRETAIERNPLVSDPEKEAVRIKEEEKNANPDEIFTQP